MKYKKYIGKLACFLFLAMLTVVFAMPAFNLPTASANNLVAPIEVKPLPIRENYKYTGDESEEELYGYGGFAADRVLVRMSGLMVQSFSTNFFGIEVESVENLMTLGGGAGARSLPDSLKIITLKDKSVGAVQHAIAKLNNTAGIVYAEKDNVVRIMNTPGDTDFNTSGMWGMKKIFAPDAWDVETGSREVLVAVIDTGIDYNHPDLIDNIWVNENEIARDKIDNDGNGFVDDVYGWSYIWGDESSNKILDTNGHGTHVAGIIGAVGDNGRGIAGVSWNVKMMPVKAFNNVGGGFTSDIIKSVGYANLMNADIINCSYGSTEYNQAERDAMAASSALFVVAAGNNKINSDVTPVYPANYDLDNIITVAATDKDDTLANFSNYGADTVDIAAPGVDIFSTTPINTYGVLSGTSMATPFVAGTAALVLSSNSQMTAQQIKARIIQSVDPVPALSDKVASGGRLNAHRALVPDASALTPFMPSPPPAPPVFTGFAGGDGSQINPYQISTPLHLYGINDYLDKYFIQINDIDMTYDTQDPNGMFYNETQGWEPLGSLTGEYDGGGYKITGLKAAEISAVVCGLFGVNRGKIINLGLVDCDIAAMQPGSIAGRNYGIIENCYTTGRVAGLGYVGGITSLSGGELIGCHNAADVFDCTDYVSIVGGIVSTGSIVTNCYNTGSINAQYNGGDVRLGGIFAYGFEDDYIVNCYSAGISTNLNGSGFCAVTSSSWDIIINNSYCLGTYGSNGGIVLTETQMKRKSSFYGWDFETVWNISPTVNNGYPVLRAFNGGLPNPAYGITLDAANSYTFASATAHYQVPPSRTFKVTNTGNQYIGELTVALSGADAGAFDLSVNSLAGLGLDGETAFDISPLVGLEPDTYTATLTVSGEGLSESVEVRFTVNPMPEYNLAISLGYSATVFDSIVLEGWDDVRISKLSGNDKINWNSDENRIEIRGGLRAGKYKVELLASNGQGGSGKIIFTLTVGTAEERIDELERQLDELNKSSQEHIAGLEETIIEQEDRIKDLEETMPDSRLSIAFTVSAVFIAISALGLTIILALRNRKNK